RSTPPPVVGPPGLTLQYGIGTGTDRPWGHPRLSKNRTRHVPPTVHRCAAQRLSAGGQRLLHCRHCPSDITRWIAVAIRLPAQDKMRRNDRHAAIGILNVLERGFGEI